MYTVPVYQCTVAPYNGTIEVNNTNMKRNLSPFLWMEWGLGFTIFWDLGNRIKQLENNLFCLSVNRKTVCKYQTTNKHA